ncbi:MAG: Iron-sulfur cluster carrier protein [Proteobacteria bacterium]|nr:MAG: Iron-sulfur cluster carrier protein [Pseudomonadota bacterium]
MYTILIMSRKGGSGKSTTAMNMATRFAKAKYQVALMDFDPQKTLTKWFNRRDEYMQGKNTILHSAATESSFKDEVKNLEQAGCDVLIIDTPPTINDFHNELLDIADFALVPTKTTMEDLETIAEVVDVIESNETAYGFVINETKNKTLLYLSIKDVLVEYGAVLGTITGTVQIPEASIKGLALCEYKPDNINCQQYDKIFKNLNRRLKNKKK